MSSGLLGVAVSGLQAFQRSISVAGHNITNANTEGFSRQRVELNTRAPSYTGAGYIGNGVQIGGIERMYDQFAVDNLRTAISSSSRYDSLATYSGRVSNLLSDENTGLNIGLEEFFNAVQTVADDPSSGPARQLLISEAGSLVSRFQNLDTQLESMRDEINAGLKTMVSEVNSLSAAIAETNRKIVDASGRSQGEVPNDLLDARDQLVSQLSDLVAVRTLEQDDGALNVFVGTGQSLVTGVLSSQLHTVPNAFDAQRLEIGISTGAAVATVTDSMTGGKLGATLDFEEQILNPTQNALGRIAVTMATEFNAQHSSGMDLNGVAGGDFFGISAPSVAPNTNNTGGATIAATFDSANIDELTTDDYVLGFDGAAWSLSRARDGQAVSMTGTGPYFANGIEIAVAGGAAAGDRFMIRPTGGGSSGLSVAIDNPREIAAAAQAADPAPGDNSNALLLAGLQTGLTMERGTTNFQGAYGQLIGDLGTKTRSAQITAEAQGAILAQAHESRDAISGVNLDEEAADLIRFQQAYSAIAQVISVADSTFQTLLGAIGR